VKTAAAPTSIAAVAEELVVLCRAGRNMDAINAFYSPKIVSIESGPGSKEMPATMTGIDAIRKKNEWWLENHEVHSADADGPFVGEDKFAVRWDYDITVKANGQRVRMEEMALYTVENGKIVKEQFFYNMG